MAEELDKDDTNIRCAVRGHLDHTVQLRTSADINPELVVGGRRKLRKIIGEINNSDFVRIRPVRDRLRLGR